jgi:uncharacterized protein (TIGR02246 family)
MHQRFIAAPAFAILLLGVVTVLAPRAGAEELEDLKAASDSVHQTIIAALADEDSQLLASVFTGEGAIIAPTGESMLGRLTIRASATLLFLTVEAGEVDIDRYSLNIIDGEGYETGRYLYKEPAGEGQSRQYMGRYTLVWQKEDGRWRVHRAIAIR